MSRWANNGLMHGSMIGETLSVLIRTSLDLRAQEKDRLAVVLSKVRSSVLIRSAKAKGDMCPTS
jgi:hypothetical protein